MEAKKKRKEMSEVERQQISRWREEGESYTEIARRLVRPVNTVRDCALRIQKRESVDNAPRSGRPRKEAPKRVRAGRRPCRKCAKAAKQEALAAALASRQQLSHHQQHILPRPVSVPHNLASTMNARLVLDTNPTHDFVNHFDAIGHEIAMPPVATSAPDPVLVESQMSM